MSYIYQNILITMGLFTKKEEKKGEIPRMPELPKLPELPDFPEMKKDYEDYNNEKISQLPSFPNGSLGNKFSQYNIKEAVSGKKEEGGEFADEFADEEMQTMQKPLVVEPKKINYSRFEKVKEAEPIFVRIDKFEEGSQTFEEAKKQITDIERMFEDLKKVKEDEERELKNFEEELRQIKEKIGKIDENIFSKVG